MTSARRTAPPLALLLVITALLLHTSSATAKNINRIQFGGATLDTLPNISTTSNEVNAFNRWFWNMSPHVNWKLSTLPSQYGNGIFVSNATSFPSASPDGVKRHEVIIEVPVEFTITTDSIKSKPYGRYLDTKLGLSEEDAVTLSLLTESLMGKASKVHKWMRILPRPSELVPPYRWQQSELSWVEPRSARRSAEHRARELKQQYDALLRNNNQPIQKLNDFLETLSAKTNNKKKLKEVDFNRYVWAKSLIDTRAWNINGHKYFVPFADMFNHKPDAEEETFDFKEVPSLHHRSQKFLQHHKIISRKREHFMTKEQLEDPRLQGKAGSTIKFLQVLADRDASPGGQMYESYGDNSNDIYFGYHGFVPEEGNRYDCQDVDFNPQDMALNEKQKSLLSRLARMAHLQRRVCVHMNEVPPLALVVALVKQLDNDLVENTCIVKAVNAFDPRHYPFKKATALYNKIKSCTKAHVLKRSDQAPATAEVDPVLEAKFTSLLVEQWKLMKKMVMKTYKQEFQTSQTKTDLEKLKDVEAELTAVGSEATKNSATNNEVVTTSHRLRTALKFRIGRKKILNKLVGTCNKKIKSLQAEVKALKLQANENRKQQEAAAESNRGDVNPAKRQSKSTTAGSSGSNWVQHDDYVDEFDDEM